MSSRHSHKRDLSPRQKSLILLPLLSVTLILDQLSKQWAIGELRGQYPRSYAANIFRLEYSENTGAFLGLGSALPEWLRFWLLNIFVGIVLGLSTAFLFRTRGIERPQVIGLSLLISGGASNLLDRFFRDGRYVVDFMNIGLGQLRSGIFNVADIAIMAGIFLFVLAQPRASRSH